MIIVDSDNYAASGIEVMFFPGGEPHVKCPIFEGTVLLFLKLRTWNDVGIAACLIDALSRQEVKIIPFIPYFPGARQDRVTNERRGKDPFTAYLMANLLGYPHGATITFDPHSPVLHEHIDLIEIGPQELAVPIKDDVVGIIAPDQGATKRAEAFRWKFYRNAQLIQFYKKRDAESGRLVLDKDRLPDITEDGRYIIVDDICDGGATFNLLAHELHTLCVLDNIQYKLELFVSHGIFSKGLDAIDSRIDHITTTDSWYYFHNARISDRITVLKLDQLFPKIEGWFNYV